MDERSIGLSKSRFFVYVNFLLFNKPRQNKTRPHNCSQLLGKPYKSWLVGMGILEDGGVTGLKIGILRKSHLENDECS
jgi:hypothetical protein